ncbi:hypothetical protein FJM67_01320 [Maribrevibacterium harenarium]|uniref:Uncharacterized protein n=1 Tax=Maribrevibacterium harenarium TaxID=2589817 RepID=A0A501X454_9GAMM|nr:hypothetical protein [Maribrevibacterium harenarium]TPE55219.1 hypothetical protein FJM67_01320 [Maribrevibacterium harenarium]
MSISSETVSEVKTDLLHASISLQKEEDERNQKEDSVRMLKARRAIEDYLEEKRLKRSICDGWDD